MGRHEETEPAFRRALEVELTMDRARYCLVLVLIRARRFDEAYRVGGIAICNLVREGPS